MEKDWEFNSLAIIWRIQGVKESRIRAPRSDEEKLQEGIREVERMLKGLIKSLENKHLNPRIPEP